MARMGRPQLSACGIGTDVHPGCSANSGNRQNSETHWLPRAAVRTRLHLAGRRRWRGGIFVQRHRAWIVGHRLRPGVDDRVGGHRLAETTLDQTVGYRSGARLVNEMVAEVIA